MEAYERLIEERIALTIPRIQALIYRNHHLLEVAAWVVPGEPVAYADAVDQEFSEFAVGREWGTLWSTIWFRFRGQISDGWDKSDAVALVSFAPASRPIILVEGFTAEGLVYQDGRITGAINANRFRVQPASVAKDGSFEFFIEGAANGSLTKDWEMVHPKEGERLFRLHQAEMALVDREAEAFYYDFRVWAEVLSEYEETSQARATLRKTLNEAASKFDPDDRSSIAAARQVLTDYVGEGRDSASRHQIVAVGHAHIDTAWLWPLRESIRKCARTFSTVLSYMKGRPEFRFSCSQAQHYVWMQVHYPEIFQGIVEAVRRGQWEPVGSMWIEPDCNLISGESFIRQIVQGKRFFQREFGVETKDVWLPDAFGYAASMPQILRGCGIDWFISQKMSWNQFNKFPHHTFRWEGIDGSEVRAHFPPVDTYNAEIRPRTLKYSVNNFRQKDKSNFSLMPFGWGDGGGGPSMEHLEFAERLENVDGLPRLELGRVDGFLAKLEAESASLPVWQGELYLELHRGTFTSQAKAKQGNRQSEQALHDAEFLDGLASVLAFSTEKEVPSPARAVYDVPTTDQSGLDAHRRALDRAWKLVLLNQFHDILPGSSIGWVYEDVARDYQAVRELTQGVVSNVIGDLGGAIDTSGYQRPCLVVNTLGCRRREVLTLDDESEVMCEVPAYGYAVIEADRAESFSTQPPIRVNRADGGVCLENGLIRLAVNERGQLASVYDVEEGREVLAPGRRGNVFELYTDHPNKHDAWDIDLFSLDTCVELDEPAEIEIEPGTAGRRSVVVMHRFRDSWLRQRIILTVGSKRIDFETEVEWQECHRLLKVAFPVDIRTRQATCEIPFGAYEHATYQNTSWDAAQFEICAHRWVDLSEPGYGVALLNDCKYGHSIDRNTIRLSLLKSPIIPDPTADRGRHQFTYSILPHAGTWQEAGVLTEAQKLNAPLRVLPLPVQPGTLPPAYSLFQVEHGSGVIETVKRADDGDDLIVRIYEAFGARGETIVMTPHRFASVTRTDLLENDLASVICDEGRISVYLRPFEIITLRFTRG